MNRVSRNALIRHTGSNPALVFNAIVAELVENIDELNEDNCYIGPDDDSFDGGAGGSYFSGAVVIPDRDAFTDIGEFIGGGEARVPMQWKVKVKSWSVHARPDSRGRIGLLLFGERGLVNIARRVSKVLVNNHLLQLKDNGDVVQSLVQHGLEPAGFGWGLSNEDSDVSGGWVDCDFIAKFVWNLELDDEDGDGLNTIIPEPRERDVTAFD